MSQHTQHWQTHEQLIQFWVGYHSTALECSHLPSQESAGITAQPHLSFCGNELSSPGDVPCPLPIPSSRAPLPALTPPTDILPHLPLVGTSPRVIEQVAAEHDLRAVGSHQIQEAAGKRRKKDGIYQCHFCNAGCNATFTAAHNLRYHLNAHRGLKPYKCAKCSYAGDSPTTLKRHMKRHPSSCKGTGKTIEIEGTCEPKSL